MAILWAAALLSISGGSAPAPSALSQEPATCARVHEVWKEQLEDLKSAGRPASLDRWVDQVYAPHKSFWAGYVGDEAAFRRWAHQLQVKDDPRLNIPLLANLSDTIRSVTYRSSELAGRPLPCSDWYLAFGPGWTNAGGLGELGMVVDFLGMPKKPDLEDFRISIPHEVSHLMWAGGRHGSAPVHLLHRLIDEGLATYFAEKFYGGSITAAQALGYNAEELAWALGKEGGLWRGASDLLNTTDKDVIDAYMSASSRPVPEAPGKLGYFMGYRIVAAYVERNGSESWRDLYVMQPEEILERSGYASIHAIPPS
jgi:hypothetical protein